jgi:hypothetical protein
MPGIHQCIKGVGKKSPCLISVGSRKETKIQNERGDSIMLRWFFILLLSLASIVLISGVSTAESPTDKGVYSLSGGISYMHVEGEGDFYSISPSCLYFAYDNIGIGLSATYGRSDFDDYTATDKGIGPVIRWYFPLEQKFFVEASYRYLDSETERSSSSHDTTSKQWSYVLGADYFISRNVAIEPALFYRDSDYEAEYESGYNYSNSTRYFGFSVGINVFIF